jgi:hypothetical protein
LALRKLRSKNKKVKAEIQTRNAAAVIIIYRSGFGPAPKKSHKRAVAISVPIHTGVCGQRRRSSSLHSGAHKTGCLGFGCWGKGWEEEKPPNILGIPAAKQT